MASYIVGIDIGGTNTNIGVVRPDGTVAAFASMATEKDSGPAVCVSRMLKETNALLGQSEFRKGQVLGVGMGMPGCIDIANGTVISSPNFPSSWFDFPLRDSIAKALRVPAVIDNDARAAMVGEGWCGVAKGVQNYVVLTLGTGIGGGAMLGGRILRGANGYAGEFGHICVRPGGRTCGCTRQGCVEAYASGTGVLGNFRELSAAAGVPGALTGAINAKEVYDLAEKGHPLASRVVNEACEALGTAIGVLVNALNPELVALAGRISRSFDTIEPLIRQHAQAHSLSTPFARVRIKPSALVERAGVIGAAGLLAYEQRLL